MWEVAGPYLADYWTSIAALLGFAFAVCVKASFDFHYGFRIVKWFRWLPVRWLFQEKPASLGGSWSHVWEHDGETHREIADRHGNSDLYQLGRYVCCDHYAPGVKYEFFGVIRGGYVTGIWYDSKTNLGYSGSFHLRIVSEKNLKGSWIGHSSSSNPGEIDGNLWTWTKNAR